MPTGLDANNSERRDPGAGGPPSGGRGGPSLRRGTSRWGERAIEFLLMLAAASSVLITVGIVAVLIKESMAFFREASVREFLTGPSWAPAFEPPAFGIRSLVSGTLVTTAVALLVAIPVGTIVSVWLSEYAKPRVRETVKPALELLSAIPTVVFGYFALLFVTPALQWLFARVGIELPGFNMLSAGLVMGVMIVPYIASLSEDAMRSVPAALREGALAMGATKFQTAVKVVFPAALSGITAAYILGISRALGETMIVAIAAGQEAKFTFDPTEQAQTITAFIVQISGGDLPHESTGYRSIFAAGLTLMLMTLAFNVGGFLLRRRYKETY